MTRKQALQAALKFLRQDDNNAEIVRILSEICDEMPLARWTDASVRDAVEQYIADHGKLPNPKEFGKKNLPSSTVFKLHYNMSTGEWLEKNYGVSEQRRQQQIAEFLENYNRITPVGPYEYDRKKSPGSACVKTLLRDHDCSSWAELLAKFNLPVYPPRSLRRNTDKLKVTIYCDEL